MARRKYVGVLCVHRMSSLHEHLAATVYSYREAAEKYEFFYYPAPKCFDALITNGLYNCIEVEFTADEKGRNPRAVRALSFARNYL